jgi:multiple sugar transport system ATP-binding protein
VRPEDLYESEPHVLEGRAARLPVRVIGVEPLGAETLLMLSLEGSNEELIARIGRDTTLRSGVQTTVGLDTTALHFFDPETTRAIAWA